MVRSLPLITAGLPGIGGQIKSKPSHFVVEEVPLYAPAGQGEHIYLRLTREGWTTRAVQARLAELFGLREVDVGCAGLKDKRARVTQTFSLWLPHESEARVAELVRDSLPFELDWVKRHRNKIKAGHLVGNAFRILVVGTGRNATKQATKIAELLRERGVPNFYGAQRFGMDGDNATRGRAILVGRKRVRDWTGRFLVAAYVSSLFNDWLAERMRFGWFESLLTGDIAKKTDTGGLFEVEDASIEQPRFRRGEITYTGPIYGYKMRWATGEPGTLEREVLEDSGVTEAMLHRAGVRGSRRRARLLIEDLTVNPDPLGLRFTFTLPKGAYATIVLREFMKPDEEPPEVGQAKD